MKAPCILCLAFGSFLINERYFLCMYIIGGNLYQSYLLCFTLLKQIKKKMCVLTKDSHEMDIERR